MYEFLTFYSRISSVTFSDHRYEEKKKGCVVRHEVNYRTESNPYMPSTYIVYCWSNTYTILHMYIILNDRNVINDRFSFVYTNIHLFILMTKK